MPEGPSVLLITHLPEPELGLWTEILDRHRVAFVHRNVFTDTLPVDLAEVAAIISLGGQMSVTGLSRYPFLADELELMRGALIRRTPVFGVCLGAQLLAVAAGGDIRTMGERYIGWPELSLTAAAADDPLFAECPTNVPVMKWHADGIEVPSEVAVLATTPSPGCAVFRAGECAWGSQMHLEADDAMLFDRWLPDPIEIAALNGADLDPVAFTAESRRLLPAQITAMRPVLARFAAYVGQRPRPDGTSTTDAATRAV
jgi:GMP synthase-like glutamine amidotransferase